MANGTKVIEIPEVLTDWKRLWVTISGVTPLMMHNPAGMAKLEEKKKSLGGKKYIPTPEEESEWGTYRLEKGELYVPSDSVRQSAVNGASGMKIGKLFLTRLLSAGLILDREWFSLERVEQPLKQPDRIDVRGVMIQRARVTRARPVIDLPWQVTAEFLTDVALFRGDAIGLVVQAIQQAGQTVGLLEYRPQKGGSFGRYEVLSASVEE